VDKCTNNKLCRLLIEVPVEWIYIRMLWLRQGNRAMIDWSSRKDQGTTNETTTATKLLLIRSYQQLSLKGAWHSQYTRRDTNLCPVLRTVCLRFLLECHNQWAPLSKGLYSRFYFSGSIGCWLKKAKTITWHGCTIWFIV
jgi:hypothetical protein